jgi:hypothetical protein
MFVTRLVRSLVVLVAIAPAALAAQSPFSSVPMELVLTQNGAEWKADVRFTISGQKTTDPVRELRVEGESVSFVVEIRGADVRFTGTLAEGKLSGTLEATEGGQRVATGAWSLTSTGGDGGALAGKWEGTFSAKPAGQQAPNSGAGR